MALRIRRLVARARAGPRQWVLIGGGVLVLLLLGAGAWYWRGGYRAAGGSAFSHASSLVQEAVSPRARPEQLNTATGALEDFLARYPRHPSVPQAAYHLGNLRYHAKAYQGAREAYQLGLQKGASGSLVALSRLGIGYAWEAQGDYARALAAYREAATSHKHKDFLLEESLLAVGRAQELLQQREPASETYRGILRDFPQSVRAEEARFRLGRLEAVSSR